MDFSLIFPLFIITKHPKSNHISPGVIDEDYSIEAITFKHNIVHANRVEESVGIFNGERREISFRNGPKLSNKGQVMNKMINGFNIIITERARDGRNMKKELSSALVGMIVVSIMKLSFLKMVPRKYGEYT